MAHRKRTVQLHFMVTEHERELIRQKMEQLGTNNLGAYLRKMAIDGYIVKLDLPELSELFVPPAANQQQCQPGGPPGASDRECLRYRFGGHFPKTTGALGADERDTVPPGPCFVNGAWFPKLGGRTAGYRSVLPLLFLAGDNIAEFVGRQ